MPAPLGQQACAPHRTGGRRHPDLVRPTGPPRGSPGGSPPPPPTTPPPPRTARGDEAPRISSAQLDRRVDRLAAGLHALGLRRGDRAMVQLPNSIGFVNV